MAKRLHIRVTCTRQVLPDWQETTTVYDGENFNEADQAAVTARYEYPALFIECRIKVWHYGELVVDKQAHTKRTKFALNRRYR